MVFGTFDFLHQGHLNFFRQARRLAKNPFLIVSVARDLNVEKIKGAKPFFTEKQRLLDVQKCRLADRAILGAKANYIGHILKQKPSVIALGYDQSAYTKNLNKKLRLFGLNIKIVRLKAFRRIFYRSSKIKKVFNE